MFKEGELHMQQYPVRTIDLEALRENVRLLRSTLPEKTKLMAVVKADAYGHGIAKVAVPRWKRVQVPWRLPARMKARRCVRRA